MTESKKHYTPWERTEAEDLQVQKTLDEASANQMAGFVDELLAMSEKDTESDQSTSS